MCRVILGLVCISSPFFLYMVMYVVIDIHTEYQTSCHPWCFLWLAEGEGAICFESWCGHLSSALVWIGLFGHLAQSVAALDPGI